MEPPDSVPEPDPPEADSESDTEPESEQAFACRSTESQNDGVTPIEFEPVAFETGNPNTGTVVTGTLHLEPLNGNSTLLVLQSIPGLMNESDLCRFLASHADSILHIRPVRQSSERNRYLAVVLFTDTSAAHAFAEAFTGKPYLRGLVSETVSLRSIRTITFSKQPKPTSTSSTTSALLSSSASTTSSPTSTPSSTSEQQQQQQQQKQHQRQKARNTRRSSPSNNQYNSNRNNKPSLASKSSLFPRAEMFPRDISHLPAPNCPVCLEPFDASSTLFTTFCNHTMHASCLARWGLDRCPVCRYAHELKPEATECMQCSHNDDLWMCVVCAFVGCGYYKKKHAEKHFLETQHPFALNLKDSTFWSGETLPAGMVWDYVSERFVDRLATSVDGKIVEVDARGPTFSAESAVTSSERTGFGASSGGGTGAAGSCATGSCAAASCSGGSHYDAAAAIFTTSCMTSSSTFNSNVHNTADSCCGSSSRIAIDEDVDDNRRLHAAVHASRVQATVDEYRRRLGSVEAEQATERANFLQQIEQLQAEVTNAVKEKKAMQKRVVDAEKEMKSLSDKNGFLKSLNETLLRDKQGWNDEVERLKAQVEEFKTQKEGMEEQLRDVMMHLETQAKISGSGSGDSSCRSDASELRGADVVRVGPSARKRLAMKAKRRHTGT